MVNFQNFDYELPKDNLALKPASPRDSSKLFIYDTAIDKIIFDRFYNLDRYLPKNSFLVLNNTKVLPARVEIKKESGGKAVILFLINELTNSRIIKAMSDRKINVGEKLFFKNGEYITVESQDKHIFVLKHSFSKNRLFDLLKQYGTMPIPLYLKETPLKRDELLEKYQTIFAKKEGSAAAPTASLHFTERVFKKLEKKGIEKYFVTLHVGLGTFAPVTDENIKMKKLHEEYYEIDRDLLKLVKAKRLKGEKLVAVGTTVTRTLESVTNQINQKTDDRISDYQMNQTIRRFVFSRPTSLFIFPPFNFKMVDIMITNFHLPKSSLMMLVEAFLQYKRAKRHLVDLYNIAIKNNFRFYSFGDAMVII